MKNYQTVKKLLVCMLPLLLELVADRLSLTADANPVPLNLGGGGLPGLNGGGIPGLGGGIPGLNGGGGIPGLNGGSGLPGLEGMPKLDGLLNGLGGGASGGQKQPQKGADNQQQKQQQQPKAGAGKGQQPAAKSGGSAPQQQQPAAKNGGSAPQQQQPSQSGGDYQPQQPQASAPASPASGGDSAPAPAYPPSTDVQQQPADQSGGGQQPQSNDGGAQSNDPMANEMLQLIKKERAGKPICLDSKLTKAAQDYAKTLTSRKLVHTGADRSTAEQRIKKAGFQGGRTAENLADNQNVAMAHQELMASTKGHKENILNGDFNKIGLGFAKKPNGNIIVVQTFGQSNTPCDGGAQPASGDQPNQAPAPGGAGGYAQPSSQPQSPAPAAPAPAQQPQQQAATGQPAGQNGLPNQSQPPVGAYQNPVPAAQNPQQSAAAPNTDLGQQIQSLVAQVQQLGQILSVPKQ